VVAAALGLGTLAPPAHADPGVSCGDTLMSSVVLTEDLDCSAASGDAVLTIGADGVTLNLGGHEIRGTDGYSRVVDVQSRTRVTIRGGTIDGPSPALVGGAVTPLDLGPVGVYVVDSTHVRITDLTVRDTGATALGTGIGVLVFNGTRVRLQEVTSTANGQHGALVFFSADVRLSRSAMTGNGAAGMLVDSVTRMRVHDSQLDGNGGSGLVVLNSAQFRLSKASASGNAGSGVEMEFIEGARLHRLAAADNAADGITVGACDPCEVRKSELARNGDSGLHDSGSALRLLDTALVDNGADGLLAEGSTSFLIRKVRAELNGDDGVDIRANSLLGPYRLEDTASDSNGDAGFEVEFPVQSRGNSAAGNGGSNAVP